jgi:hypothetical protein
MRSLLFQHGLAKKLINFQIWQLNQSSCSCMEEMCVWNVLANVLFLFSFLKKIFCVCVWEANFDLKKNYVILWENSGLSESGFIRSSRIIYMHNKHNYSLSFGVLCIQFFRQLVSIVF